MSEYWYAVQSKPRAEARARENLVRQRFEVYLPNCLRSQMQAGKVVKSVSPLFPGYLFVSAQSAQQRWKLIRSTFGVARLVATGETPAVLSNDIVGALRQREVDGLVRLPARTFSSGQRVRVVDGAFADCYGLFDGMCDQERVCVLLDLMGRKARVVISRMSLAPT